MSRAEPATRRLRGGALVTQAKPRFQWARITEKGKVHAVKSVVVRWNFLGGTRERPDVSFVFACGPQSRWVAPVADPKLSEVCVRCDGVTRRRQP